MGAGESDQTYTSASDQLAQPFYDWEMRGRGWLLWDEPVELEPPFRPFRGHSIEHHGATDDGRKHTIVSGLLNWIQRSWRGDGSVGQAADDDEESEPQPWQDDSEIVELQVSLPSSLRLTRELAEQFLLSLSALSMPPSYELIGTSKAILLQFTCATDDADYLRQQLEAHFPGVVVTTGSNNLRRTWEDSGVGQSVIAELGLSREFMLPLMTEKSFAVDPMLGIAAALADVAEGEVAAIQVLFTPVRHPWAESVLRSVTFADGTPLFAGGRDVLDGAEDKVARPLYAVVIRLACRSGEEDEEGKRAWELARRLIGALAPLNNPEGNELIPLNNEEYDDPDDHEEDFLQRRTRRSGMLLSSDELVSLVHLPTDTVQVPKLRLQTRKSAVAPPLVLNHRTTLGINEHAGQTRGVTLSSEQRAKHVHLIGASGTGKSTLLLNLIAQDLRTGDGIAVLDPHGDLIDDVLRLVPPERASDVILIDPADEDHPIGFNVLSAHSALEKNLLASDLVAVFRRLATSWGDQMTSVLGNAILAFLESPKGGTLVDLRRFLVEPGFRKQFLSTCTDGEVVYYWQKEFPLLTGRPQGPVLTRLDTFLRPKPIRHMVAQRESRLDFADILDNGRILLARLSHGAIGAENAHLLGTLLVSKLHQLALGRQRMREEERKYFWLYIDEFHHFATPSMASILSGVRKYRLGLTLAHQEMQQLDSVPEVAGAVSSNAYTRICFRLGDADAKKLESGFANFEAKDLQNLGTGEAIARVERAEMSFNLKTQRPPKVDESKASAVREEVIRGSRQRYATRRAEVEAMLNRARGESGNTEASQATGEEATSPTQSEAFPAPKLRNQEVEEKNGGERAVEPHPPTPPSQPNGAGEDPSVPATPPITRQPSTSPSDSSGKVKAMGRGGSRHQHLQRLIKQWAEGLGYRASIEEQVLGTRAADIALQKDEVSIAVELCVTTTFVHELGNIRKCLDAGFLHVVALSPAVERLAKLREVVEPQLEEAESGRVRFFSPDELFAFVREIEMQRAGSPAGKEGEGKTVRGYKVRTTLRPVTGAERKAKQQNISDVIAKSIRQKRQRESDGK